MDLLDRMLKHNYWATTQLLEVSRDLTDAQLDQPFDVGHGTLRDTFDHMIFNIAFWTGLMNGQPVSPDRSDRSMPALIERHESFFAAYASLARRVHDEQRLDETFVDHHGLHPTCGGAILQVTLHNEEHRTEARHILERLGVPDLPEVDHLLWEHTTKGT